MSRAVVLQQQRPFGLVIPTYPAWEFWDADTIAWATRCPKANVLSDWPLLVGSLARFGINDRAVQAALIGTVAIETASTFKPVREAYWLDDQWGYERAEIWRRANLRYWPYYGRGHLQATWDFNYRMEGEAIGIDLVSNPDLMLDPWISADFAARYFYRRPALVAACRRGDLPEVRRLVQGAHAGLDRLYEIVNRLGG